MRSDFRAFRLDRIQKLIVTSEKFNPHKTTLEDYFEECRKKYCSTPDTPMAQVQCNFASNHKNKKMQTIKIEPFNIIGISIRTTNENGQANKDIAELWQRFMSENTLSKIPNKADSEIYSLYIDYESDHTKPYTAILGCKVENLDDIPNGMLGKSFHGGKYVKTTVKGDLMKGLIVNHWSKIFEMNLNRNYIADFEIFGKKAQNPSDAEVDFYVGVKTE